MLWLSWGGGKTWEIRRKNLFLYFEVSFSLWFWISCKVCNDTDTSRGGFLRPRVSQIKCFLFEFCLKELTASEGRTKYLPRTVCGFDIQILKIQCLQSLKFQKLVFGVTRLGLTLQVGASLLSKLVHLVFILFCC